ncbi:MAG TPA: hypothetical protein VK673_21915 [Chthoniobacterales bacterium]|nr:hypothetical protein [Chthoniobacterales bacterium]
MNTQHTNHYYVLEYYATNEQLELQHEAPDLDAMMKAGEAYLGTKLFDEETDWTV